MEEGSLHRSVPAECMEWHPVTKVIAIGWRSGEITTYNYSENLIYEQSSIHRSPLAVIKWNQNGSRLVSGDAVNLELNLTNKLFYISKNNFFCCF